MTRILPATRPSRMLGRLCVLCIAIVAVLRFLPPSFVSSIGRPRTNAAVLTGASSKEHWRQARTQVSRKRMAANVVPGLEFMGEDFALLDLLPYGVAILPAVFLSVTTSGDKRLPDKEYIGGSDADIPKESAFSFDDWDEHRQNPQRYLSVVAGLLGRSTVLKRLSYPLFCLNVWSAVTLFYDQFLVPLGLPVLLLPALPFTISASALGLLLVFRVTSANNRYVLARNLWGDIVNTSRNLARQSHLWANRDEFMEFSRWLPAFSASLMVHLRSEDSHDLRTELRRSRGPEHMAQEVPDIGGLTETEIEEVMNRPGGLSAPMFVLHRLSVLAKNMKYSDEVERLVMENALTKLYADVGACENIFSTPVPLGYTKHTTRFLFLWLSLLPLALEGQLGAGAVFGEQLLAFGLLGIEDIGIQLEEPFCVLPLERPCGKMALENQTLRINYDHYKQGLKIPGNVPALA